MKKKLLTILLSIFMSLGCFVNVVHADISTINDVINVSNIPEMTGLSIPEDAWTNGFGGYLVIQVNDILFTNAEQTNSYTKPKNEDVTNNGNGTYVYTNGTVYITFTISDNTLVNVIVSGPSDPYGPLNGIYTAPTPTKVAKIGSIEYATLEDAISAVKDSETIVILQDITYGTPITINNGKTFTIDFNDGSSSHSFTWDVTSGSTIDQDIFTIGSNSDVTVKNMKFLANSSDEEGNRIFKVNNTGTLTLSQMESNDENGKRNIPVLNYGGVVTIDGGNITTDATNRGDLFSPNALNPVVQNLGGTTTFTGNGTYTMKNTSTGAAWLGNVITMSEQSTDADCDSECGTIIIENGTFNGGQIVDVNGKGNIIINDATYKTGIGPIIKTFHGGIKSNITVNNITASTTAFAQVIEELETKIDFKNGNVKYNPTYFCFKNNASQPMISVSIKNGKFGPKSGATDIHDEITALCASGYHAEALAGTDIEYADGYRYKVVDTYTIIEGGSASIDISLGQPAIFKSSADKNKFVKVTVNDVDLNSSNYDVTEGSTIVTLKPTYLSTLANGTYDISIISTDGHADTTFTITNTSTPTPNPDPTPRYKVPNTGVEGTTNNHSLLKLSSLSLLAVGTYMVLKKKKDNK